MSAWERTEVERLHLELIDTPEDGERASIHLELGRMALSDGRVELAARHFKEALVLDLHLEQARSMLVSLGENTMGTIHVATRPRTAIRSFVQRLRRRS